MADRRRPAAALWQIAGLLILCIFATAAAAPVQAQSQRHLMVVFAGAYPPPSNGPAPYPASPEDRSLEAMRAVRQQFEATGIVDAIVYLPDSPVFLRAAQEAKLKVNLANPSDKDRQALTKAIGGRFVIVTLAAPDPQGGIALELQSYSMKTKKRWATRQRVAIQSAAPSQIAVAPRPFSDDILSAANTAVQKFMLGPLKNYTRSAPPRLPAPTPPPTVPDSEAISPATTTPAPTTPAPTTPVTPPPPASTPVTAPPAAAAPASSSAAAPMTIPPPAAAPPAPTPSAALADRDAEIRGSLIKADELVKAGDVGRAIVLLRRVVDMAPRAPAPRAALVRAYLKGGRAASAVDEARSALSLMAASDTAGQIELTRLLAQGLALNGDTTAARAIYEQIIEARGNALWARLALAGILITQGRLDEAEAQYRTVRKAEPTSREATEQLARLRAARGDYKGALEELSQPDFDGAVRYLVARDLFINGANATIAAVLRDQKAYEQSRMSRDVFFQASDAQARRAGEMLLMLRGAPPSGDPTLLRAYRHRMLAASLLSQAMASVLSYLDTGESAANSKATVLLGEARREMEQALAVEEGRSTGPQSS